MHLHMAGLRPQSHADADLARPLRDGIRHHSVKAERREQQCEAAQGRRKLRRYTGAIDDRLFSEYGVHRSYGENQSWFQRESFLARRLFQTGCVTYGAHQQLAILVYVCWLWRVE